MPSSSPLENYILRFLGCTTIHHILQIWMTHIFNYSHTINSKQTKKLTQFIALHSYASLDTSIIFVATIWKCV